MKQQQRRLSPSAKATLAIAAIVAASAMWNRPARAADARWLAAAEAERPAVVQTLRDLVLIESGSANGAGLAKMADYTEARLQSIGAVTERIKATRGPGQLVKATWTGTGSKKLMLIAHMDTVYPEGILATQPLREDGNRLYGPGIADDKGGIAVVLHALAILKDAGWRDYATLTVLFNPDEEVGSIGSSETIASLAAEHDVVFSCEPTGAKAVYGEESLVLGTSGATTAVMEVQGRASHAGDAPKQGRNALLELAYQIVQTRDVSDGVSGARLNWTTAQGGIVRNQIPEHAVATADVRTTQPGAAERLQAALQARVDSGHLVPDTRTTIRIGPGRPAFVADERGRALAEVARGIYAELDGRKLGLVPMSGGATDAAYAARSGKPIVLESFGLAGAGYHARDEYVELDSIVPRLYLMTRMLQTVAAP